MNEIFGYRVEWYSDVNEGLAINCGLVCADTIADATHKVENEMFDTGSITELTIFTIDNNGCGCVMWEDIVDLARQFNEVTCG